MMRCLLVTFITLVMGFCGVSTPSFAQDTPPTFHCDLRTPAGDILGLTVLAVSLDGPPSLFIFSRRGESWPGDDESSLLATFEKAGDAEFQFALGNNRIRMARAGQLKNFTVWSSEENEVKQPLAFGFCGNTVIESAAELAAVDIEPFDVSRWGDRCYGTQYQPSGPTHFSFRVTHGTSDDGTLIATFFDGDGPFSEAVSLPRQLLQNGPPAESPEIFMGVARFAAQDESTGPRGMEVGYYDGRTRLMSTIMTFNTISGTDGPAYAICGARDVEIEVSQ